MKEKGQFGCGGRGKGQRKRDKKRETWTLREMNVEGERGVREFMVSGLIVPVHVRVHSWGKEGNGVQMYCIQHTGLNFNRYITKRSLFPTSKPPYPLATAASALQHIFT